MLKKYGTLARDWAEDKRKEFLKIRNFNFRTLTMCEKCYAFYYKNSWHFKKPEYLDGTREEEIHMRFMQCPACLEEENALYEMESGMLGFG